MPYHTPACTPRASSRSRFLSPRTTRGLPATTYLESEGAPADARSAERRRSALGTGSTPDSGETPSAQRRDRAAVRLGPRHGAAEARLAARARPRRAPGPSPSADQIHARWPTNSGSVSSCGCRAATPARLPPVGRGSLPVVDLATRSGRTARPDASVDLTAAPARTIADESTRFLRVPQRDGRRVSRPRSRPARWRTHACRPQSPTAAVD